MWVLVLLTLQAILTTGLDTYDDPLEESDSYEDSSEESDSYEDPSEESDSYEDPSEESVSYEAPSEESVSYEAPSEESVSYEDPSEESDSYEDPSEEIDSYEESNEETNDPKLILESYLQVDDIDSGLYDHPAKLPPKSCTRPCVRGETRTCYYQFHVEDYVTMGGACGNCTTNNKECYNSQCVTADGYERSILTINRQMPAPSIQVCEGDKIVVDVYNQMGGRSTTIHWHGLQMKDSKFMDGVPLVTQCPIQESSTFRYSFKADSWGTHFYHSHDGLQKVDGLVGSLVVRLPKKEDPNEDLYDYDLPSHVIVVQDWHHLTADSLFPGFNKFGPDQKAVTYLIQGRGKLLMENGTTIANTPLAEFKVTKGYRYVFRIVAGTCFKCQYIFTIESHDFVIIAADGRPTQPYRVDSLTMSPGERFTVVVKATRTVNAYWMTVRTTGHCENTHAHQVAVLRYSGGPKLPSTARPNHLESDANKVGITMNPVNSNCTEEMRDQDGPCLHDLRNAYSPPQGITAPQPYHRIYWVWGFYFYNPSNTLYHKGNYKNFLQSPLIPVAGTVNGIHNMQSPFPLLSQPEDLPSNLMCHADHYNLTSWKTKLRECIHVIKLPVNKVIEIVSIDYSNNKPGSLSHPIHLHGYDMYMMEMGLLNPNVPKDEAIHQLMKYLESDERREIPPLPVSKDTFPLTSGGYAVTRIFTDNPGYWFYHCHFAYHLHSGMSGILQVGEVNTFPEPPPRFPKCGNYVPDQ